MSKVNNRPKRQGTRAAKSSDRFDQVAVMYSPHTGRNRYQPSIDAQINEIHSAGDIGAPLDAGRRQPASAQRKINAPNSANAIVPNAATGASTNQAITASPPALSTKSTHAV